MNGTSPKTFTNNFVWSFIKSFLKHFFLPRSDNLSSLVNTNSSQFKIRFLQVESVKDEWYVHELTCIYSEVLNVLILRLWFWWKLDVAEVHFVNWLKSWRVDINGGTPILRTHYMWWGPFCMKNYANSLGWVTYNKRVNHAHNWRVHLIKVIKSWKFSRSTIVRLCDCIIYWFILSIILWFME